MFVNIKSPDSKSNNNQGSPNYNLRHVNSSEGPRSKMDYNKSSSRTNLVNDQSASDVNNINSEGNRQFSAHSPPQYRITTGPLRSAGPKLKSSENRNNVEEARGTAGEAKNLEHLGILQGIKGSGGPKSLAKGKEKLYEDWLELKKHVNTFQEENTKLRTRNSQLEKEACKFEKLLQEVAVNPKKQKQLLKAEEGTAPNLKQHMKELRNDLDDRIDELKSLKKKAKVTKVNELEVQIQAFQDEIARLKACTQQIIAKKTEKIMQEGEKHLIQAQNAECERLRRQIELIQSVNTKQEQICKEYEAQVSSKNEMYKKENTQINQILQAKEKEIAQLKTQLSGFTSIAVNTNKKSQADSAADAKIRKELENVALENHDLKVNIEDRNERINELQRRIKEAEAKAAEAAHAKQQEANRATEEEKMRKALQNPSYSSQPVVKEEKKEASHPVAALPKEKKPAQPQSIPKVEEKKVTLEEAKTIGYHVNLSFRVKGVPLEAIEKLDWKKYIQNGSISRDQIVTVLHTNIFGLSEQEITLLAQYLLQENHGKENKTNEVVGIRNTLSNLVGPLPHWDEEMKKKLHHSISKICTEYRESFSEALELICSRGSLTKKDLEEAAIAIDVPLNSAQLEYIITKLYERSNDPNKLSKDALFEIFSIETVEKHTSRTLTEDDNDAPASSARSRKSEAKHAVKSDTKNVESQRRKSNDRIDQNQKQSGRASKELHQTEEHKEKSIKGSQNSRRESKGESDAMSRLDNADRVYGADSDSHEDEKEEIYNDEFEGEPNKLSDEEDQDGEQYEYLFTPEDKKNSARITERGEEEEEDDAEERKLQESDKRKSKELQVKEEKPISQKSPRDVEEEEYQEEEYEEEIEEDDDKTNAKSKEEVRKSIAESGTKSGRNEVAGKTQNTSEPLASNRSSTNQKQTLSPRPESKQSGKREKDLSEEEYKSNQAKSSQSLESKGNSNAKKASAVPEDNYEEEFDAEYPEEEF